jgi:CTP:molybdopterin cytidylyltransferase MocA
MKISGLIVAAGMSRRMHDFKPLMKIGERTMLEQTVDGMLEAGIGTVTIVLGFRADEIVAHLSEQPRYIGRLAFAYNRDYEHTEMLDSVKAGICAMDACDGFFLAPGDMPAIHSNTYRVLMEAKEHRAAKVYFPTLDGFRKHPPLIDWSVAEDILRFKDEGGLRQLWKQYTDETLEIPIRDAGCAMDADFREDYEKICEYLGG